ncbi:uncharacterized protein LOC117116860 [Anneissia japonica]|uniref:uncharacterized protein LOC117116860 n=1 Tax=Anneissia japonica TaxID=1529436 RepID=UPI00142578E8|nr:uncharacterized protein LOC117116860 [Anneissia japonica]
MTPTQPFGVDCELTDCIWGKKGDNFEKCKTDCTHTIASCTDYLKRYEDNSENTPPVPNNPSSVPSEMNPEGSGQTRDHDDSTKMVSTANMESSEPHATTQHNTSGDQSEITNTIGYHVTGDSALVSDLETDEKTVSDNTDNSVSFQHQEIEVISTEYHSTHGGRVTVSDTTTVTGIMTTDKPIGSGSDTNERTTKTDDNIRADSEINIIKPGLRPVRERSPAASRVNWKLRRREPFGSS